MTGKAGGPMVWQLTNPEGMKLQQQIDAMAQDVRKLADVGEDKLTDEQKTALDDLKKKMKGLLDQQFEMRQKSEIDELKQLRERLDRLDKEISDRSKNRDSILDRQMKDLLTANRPAKVTAHGDVNVVTDAANSTDGRSVTIRADTIEFQNVPSMPTLVAMPAPAVAPAAAAVPVPLAAPGAGRGTRGCGACGSGSAAALNRDRVSNLLLPTIP